MGLFVFKYAKHLNLQIFNLCFEGSSLLNEFNTQNTNDNVVQFSFTFQVTDHPANIHNSIQSFTISVAGDNGGSASTTGSVTIQVDATQTALLEFDTWTDSLHHSLRRSGYKYGIQSSP